MRRLLILRAATIALLIAGTDTAGAVSFSRGDIVLTDIGGDADNGSLFKIDPHTGERTLIASGFGSGAGVAVDTDGQLVVADQKAVYRVDPTTGAKTVLASGGALVQPIGVAVSPQGDIYVANIGSGGGELDPLASVVRIDPQSGAQSLVSIRGGVRQPARYSHRCKRKTTRLGRRQNYGRCPIPSRSIDGDPNTHLVILCSDRMLPDRVYQ